MAVFQTERRVEFVDTDAAGIMHFAAFFTKMESAEHEMLRSLGLGVLMHDEQGEFSWPRVRAACDYRSPGRFDDVLSVAVRVAKLGDKSVEYGFTFSLGERLIAEGSMKAVCCRLGPDGPRSMTIPPAIREQLAAFQA
jgi:4-hydroxybenzoyl-CoA thioesterase/acyl-CoA thioester hydrolase